jgi:23S rRNA pseudouridine1911/1915/1917 synthase
MHQIRVHAAYHGFAIAGDMMYGDDLFNKFLAKRYKITRQLLHSYEYGFEDPRSHKQLIYQADLPSDFIRVA